MHPGRREGTNCSQSCRGLRARALPPPTATTYLNTSRNIPPSTDAPPQAPTQTGRPSHRQGRPAGESGTPMGTGHCGGCAGRMYYVLRNYTHSHPHGSLSVSSSLAHGILVKETKRGGLLLFPSLASSQALPSALLHHARAHCDEGIKGSRWGPSHLPPLRSRWGRARMICLPMCPSSVLPCTFDPMAAWHARCWCLPPPKPSYCDARPSHLYPTLTRSRDEAD